MTSKTHINWEVSAKGFLFAFPNAKEESVPVKEWQLLSLSKVDTVVVQILTQLIDEEKAEKTEYSVLLPHTIVANLPGDERDSIFLPEPFPFEIEIRSSGALADPNFRYVFRFLNGRSQPFVHPTRIGCYLEITHEQTYIIAGEQYHLIEALDVFNNRSTADKTIKNNLLEFAKIKGLAQETGSTLDAYLNRENVIAPSRLSLRLKRVDDDSIEIEPLLCEEIVDEDGNASLKAILDDDQQSSFLKTFDMWNEERELYPVPDGPRIVFDAKQKEGLGQIKQHRRVSGKEKEIMLQNPQEFFDPNVINLDSFSERVIEIGEYRPRSFPFLRPDRESWLPPEGGIIIDGTMVHIPPDEAMSFIECVKKAIQVGKKEILWKGQSVPATGETLKAAEQLVEIRPSTDTTSKEAVENSRKSDGGKNVLIIKDNLDQTNYRPGRLSHPGEPDLPRALKLGIELLPHQREGIAWLQKLWIDGAKGALLADDMGLGKTLQALTFMAWVRELMDDGKFSPQPMLVVAPVVLLKVWEEEYSKFLDPIFGPFLEMHGSNLNKYKDKVLAKSLNIKKEIEIKDKDDAESIIRSGRGMLLDVKQIRRASAVITTYETLRDYQFSLGVINWRVMVMDETQKIKNPTAMVTTAVKAMKYEFGIAMTGTPVENSWVDLWSIMDFVQPGRLGNLKEFVSHYQNPLKKEETDREALGRSLKEEVISNMLRRMKEDHLKGLPEKKVETYPVNMPDVQLNRYLEIVQKARETLPDQINGGRKQHIFTTIAALRDISLHPYLPFYSEQSMTGFSDNELINSSARLQKTIEILREVQEKKEKVIVFVISRKMQRILQRIIKNRFNIHPHIINGEIPGSRRNGLVNAFQSTTGFNIIIMSPEAAGVGLNVEKANHVIHLSRPWNPAKEDQATDRVYRIGQKQPVTVHIPLAVHPMFDNEECRGTFDQKLARLLEYKRQLSRSVLLPPVVSGNEWTKMGEEILGTRVKGEKTSGLSLSDIDRMSPEVFEKAVGAFYRKMGYQVTVTPQNKDFGADVVALAHGKEKGSFLIQCKHTIDPDRLQTQSGVQEILAATGVYSQDYKINFQTVVVTNAKGFTAQTVQVASANKVNLLCRKELKELLIKHQVSFGDIH